MQGRGCHVADPWRGPSTKCRACRCSFLLGGFQVRGGSAPRTAAHVGAPSCRYLLRDTSAGCIRQISGWHAWSGKVSEMSPRA